MSKTRIDAIKGFFLAAAIGAIAVACSPIVDQRGNLPDSELLAEIEPGKSTRQDVERKLGSPSSVATFGQEIWYYIAARTERLAFYKPEVVEQQVVAIAFDDIGMVASVQRYDLEDAHEIEPVGRVTPTSGKKLTIIQQLVDNVGRFAGKSGEQSR